MSIKVELKKDINKEVIKNFVLFCDENFRISGLDNLPFSKYSSVINKSLSKNLTKDKLIISMSLDLNQKLILIKVKNKSLDNEKLGARFHEYIDKELILNLIFLDKNINLFVKKNKYFLDEFFHGVKLKEYRFNKYKSKKKLKILILILYLKINH